LNWTLVQTHLTSLIAAAKTVVNDAIAGVLREVARRVFKIDISMSVTGRTQRSVQMATGERLEEHVIFHLKVGQPAIVFVIKMKLVQDGRQQTRNDRRL
jgi:hypothetical protein